MLQTIFTPDEKAPLSGLPPWARVIAWVGVPSVLSLGLVWFLTATVADSQATMLRQLAEHNTATVQAIDGSKAFQAEIREANRALRVLLQRICFNTARSDLDRQACIIDR